MMKRNDWSWRALWAAAALLACAWSQAAQAAPAVENIAGAMQGGAEVVRFDFSEPLTAIPSGFTIQSPARIALDVPGASNSMGRNLVDINVGNVRSVNVVQAGDRARLVLNLKAPTNYRAEIQGKSLLVMLDPVAQVSTGPAPQTFAESRSNETQPLRDMDFRRGPDGSGRVVVDLPNNQVGVDIRQQGHALVVDFLKSTLPEGLRRRMDVTDFGTPIQSVTTTQQGDRVHMVIEPRGAWEHSAYQSDNQFVVEVRAQKQDPNKLSQGPGYTGEKLSLNFQNIEVRSLLQVIADFTNFNIVTSDSVTGAVTLRLKDVPWDQALDIILQAKGLGMRRSGNVLWIAPKDEIAAKEKLELEANAAIQNLEPLRTQSFQLNYSKAADIAVQLTGSGSSRILTTRGSVIAEPRTNQLFVTDVPGKLEQVQGLIQKLDIPVRQVLIEARIVEASDTFGKSLGVRLGGSDLRGLRGGDAGYRVNGNNRVAFGGTYDAVSGTTGESNTGLTTTNTNFVNLPAAGQGGFNASTFAIASEAITGGFVAANSLQIVRAAASYALGTVTLGAPYSNVRYQNYVDAAGNEATTAFNTGQAYATWQMTPAALLGAGYSYTKGHGNGVSAAYNQFSLGVDYALSKRTDVYALGAYQKSSGRTIDASTGALVDAVASVSDYGNDATGNRQGLFLIGMRHRF